MNTNTLEFWKSVSEEIDNKDFQFLCNTSPTFHKVWNNTKEADNLNELANQFLLNYPDKNWKTSLFVLFNEITHRESTDDEWQQVRIDFVEWCVTKFTNETT